MGGFLVVAISARFAFLAFVNNAAFGTLGSKQKLVALSTNARSWHFADITTVSRPEQDDLFAMSALEKSRGCFRNCSKGLHSPNSCRRVRCSKDQDRVFVVDRHYLDE